MEYRVLAGFSDFKIEFGRQKNLNVTFFLAPNLVQRVQNTCWVLHKVDFWLRGAFDNGVCHDISLAAYSRRFKAKC